VFCPLKGKSDERVGHHEIGSRTKKTPLSFQIAKTSRPSHANEEHVLLMQFCKMLQISGIAIIVSSSTALSRI